MPSQKIRNCELLLSFAFGLGLVSLISCSHSDTTTPAPPATKETAVAPKPADTAETKTETAAETKPDVAGETKPDTWLDYASDPHGFQIKTPKSFAVSRNKTQTAAGEIEYTLYLAELPAAAFGVSCNDFPEGLVKGKDPETIIHGGSKGFVDQFSGTVTAERRLLLDGYPGLEIASTGTTQGVGIMAKGRFYLINSRLYQVYVISEKGKENLAEIDRFLESFKLK